MDNELLGFIHVAKKERDKFINIFNGIYQCSYQRTNAENLIIFYDKMVDRLTKIAEQPTITDDEKK